MALLRIHAVLEESAPETKGWKCSSLVAMIQGCLPLVMEWNSMTQVLENLMAEILPHPQARQIDRSYASINPRLSGNVWLTQG